MTARLGPGEASPEAIAYRESYVPETAPIDFSRIEQLRLETAEGYAPAIDRAIARHSIEFEDIVVGGVDCLSITSSTGGTANGRMLYCFGGGFIVGDPESDLPVAGALAEWCGVEVVAPRYRLAPEHVAPAASDDCFAVWNALERGGGRLLIAGESAGGNLALLTAQRARDAGVGQAPSALALLSPAVDLRTDRELFGTTADADPFLPYQKIHDVASVYPGDFALDDPRLSPIFGDHRGLPPTIITTGTRDLFLSMSTRLARAMRREGVDIECHVWDGLWHVFEFYDDYPESAESLRDIATFLNRAR